LPERDAYTLYDSAQYDYKEYYTFNVYAGVLATALDKINHQERQYRELNYTIIVLKVGNKQKINYD
jgi:hypothetical protein